MNGPIPIQVAEGVELVERRTGLASVSVVSQDAWKGLSWDRFVRLKAAAEAILRTDALSVLDVGGYDGALAFFLPRLATDLVDSATTGGSVLAIPADDCSYDAVAAVDVLEHIEPNERCKAIAELARVAKRHVVMNYPCRDSRDAQMLALELTNNELIREHVEWDLPDTEWVLDELKKHGFSGTFRAHTSIAIWLGQYITMHLAPNAGKELNLHLVENYAAEPTTKPLYHLVVTQRSV